MRFLAYLEFIMTQVKCTRNDYKAMSFDTNEVNISSNFKEIL